MGFSFLESSWDYLLRPSISPLEMTEYFRPSSCHYSPKGISSPQEFVQNTVKCKMVLILLRISCGLHTVLRDSDELSYLILAAAL